MATYFMETIHSHVFIRANLTSPDCCAATFLKYVIFPAVGIHLYSQYSKIVLWCRINAR